MWFSTAPPPAPGLLLLPVKVIHPLLDSTEHPRLVPRCLQPKEGTEFPVELRHADGGKADISRLALVGVQAVHETVQGIGLAHLWPGP